MVQYLGLHRGLAQLPLRFPADVRLELRIERAKEAGLARVHLRLLVVDARGKQFRFRKRDRHVASRDRHVFRTQLSQVHARHRFTLHHQQQTIADQPFRHVFALALTGNYLLHVEAHRLEPLQFLYLLHDGGLGNVDARSHGRKRRAQEVHQPRAGIDPACDPETDDGKEYSEDDPRERASASTARFYVTCFSHYLPFGSGSRSMRAFAAWKKMLSFTRLLVLPSSPISSFTTSMRISVGG